MTASAWLTAVTAIVVAAIAGATSLLNSHRSARTGERERRAQDEREKSEKEKEQLASFRNKSLTLLKLLESAITTLESGTMVRADEFQQAAGTLKDELREIFDHSRLGSSAHTHKPHYTLATLIEARTSLNVAAMRGDAAARTIDALEVLNGAILDALKSPAPAKPAGPPNAPVGRPSAARIGTLAEAADAARHIRDECASKIQERLKQLEEMGGSSE